VRLRQRWHDEGRPTADVLSELAGGSAPLSFDEIVTFGLGTLIAGGDTMANQLGLCLYQLLGDHDLACRLRRDAGAAQAAVEELLRWSWLGHTGGQPHVATQDVPLTDVVITPGQVVIPLVDAANRDLSVFPEADDFRPGRTPNPHVALGYGRHMCLGAPLVRIELQVALTALARRFTRVELAVAEDQVPWRGDMFVRGPWVLVARWEK
jgi:cytochrome P450